MIEPHKPLIDSGLAAFLIFDSNKSAPKRHKKAATIIADGGGSINNPKTFIT